jgi:hypothetical protein
MILVEDPYYNEPAHEATRGTDTGKSSAAAYNAELTLNVGTSGITNIAGGHCLSGGYCSVRVNGDNHGEHTKSAHTYTTH